MIVVVAVVETKNAVDGGQKRCRRSPTVSFVPQDLHLFPVLRRAEVFILQAIHVFGMIALQEDGRHSELYEVFTSSSVSGLKKNSGNFLMIVFEPSAGKRYS